MAGMNIPIQLIVGLGNPGPEYADTRHNAGFWWVDTFARRTDARLSSDAKFHGVAGRARWKGQDIWLLQPQTYMNLSGRAAGALARFYKIPPEAMLVVHDELDLPPGTARLKQGGGNGGHNGLKDIQAYFGTPSFWRLRLGIGHPGDKKLVSDFVLHRPSLPEQQAIDTAIAASFEVLDELLQGQMGAAMQRLHSAAKPNTGA